MDDDQTPETKWGQSCAAFEREADVGAFLFFLGGLAVLPALALMRESVTATIVALILALALFVAGYIRNVKLGRRYLRCPHCDEYPFGKSLLFGTHSLWSVREAINSACLRCHRPLGPRYISRH
ncbi:MAG: hypothetical protein HS110_16140 [Zoogloeaceae bacterium]|nr:hypothetical protein [Zoogloeaceae bacterium]